MRDGNTRVPRSVWLWMAVEVIVAFACLGWVLGDWATAALITLGINAAPLLFLFAVSGRRS